MTTINTTNANGGFWTVYATINGVARLFRNEWNETMTFDNEQEAQKFATFLLTSSAVTHAVAHYLG